MSVFRSAHSCVRAIVLAFIFAGSGLPGTGNTAAIEPLDLLPGIPPISAAEPFGKPASGYIAGPLSDKWSGALRTAEAEMLIVAQCRSDRSACPSPAAANFIEIVDSALAHGGLARLGEINRAVNLSIRPVSDLAQFGVIDFWNAPLATLAAAAGDCEDYAITKYVALREAGVALQDLRLVIWRDMRSGEDHAVAAVRFEGRWRILDNRRLMMVEDAPIRHVQPLFVLDQDGVRRYEEPAMLMASALHKSAMPPAASPDIPDRKS